MPVPRTPQATACRETPRCAIASEHDSIQLLRACLFSPFENLSGGSKLLLEFVNVDVLEGDVLVDRLGGDDRRRLAQQGCSLRAPLSSSRVLAPRPPLVQQRAKVGVHGHVSPPTASRRCGGSMLVLYRVPVNAAWKATRSARPTWPSPSKSKTSQPGATRVVAAEKQSSSCRKSASPSYAVKSHDQP